MQMGLAGARVGGGQHTGAEVATGRGAVESDSTDQQPEGSVGSSTAVQERCAGRSVQEKLWEKLCSQTLSQPRLALGPCNLCICESVACTWT